MKNTINGGYFVIIPQLVYGNKNISARSALVFGLIVSLATGKNAYCYASNAYMAELLNVSERTISSSIAELKAEQLIDCLSYTSPSPRDRTRSRMPSSA